ncbi:hypothetical protein FLK61_26070 [Paenalkalicoccus suaedae]|uniref:Uncharacterized protein n=1 Tax=Paenalkalicoccus suaedae TaxID=2592382 RepID=A0A859FB90_9BACI|nr:hypothetical protein [Paenalkalicoccus suaedae]QKS70230.1 hypothetical protein FLK61_26070 [Paenalkalicoccus suaedae]
MEALSMLFMGLYLFTLLVLFICSLRVIVQIMMFIVALTRRIKDVESFKEMMKSLKRGSQDHSCVSCKRPMILLAINNDGDTRKDLFGCKTCDGGGYAIYKEDGVTIRRKVWWKY